ncbi:MAG: bacillithiol biosynthesis cysteine-adding enzyme BshC [Flavobacteriaceae bacterium]|nr:bacillithiol biosynthesis cysteine-adding enzyme BshC [Flavobacteriaceae bacterium]
MYICFVITCFNISEIPATALLVKDYLNEKETVEKFYHKSFSYENLLAQAKEKLADYQHRDTLFTELSAQMQKLELSEKQQENLQKLAKKNTVTLTTGHQLNLMTGHLYFIYKILHVIKLCNSMNHRQKEINFVPMFWLAAEDHDFEEINHFRFRRKKIEWQGNYKNFTGEIPVSDLKTILNGFYEALKYFPFGKDLRKIIEKSYFSAENLADATRILVHELFKDYGLLMIDGNRKPLKKLFVPYIQEDIKEQKSYQKISQTIENLKPEYKIQVNPRKINFFYHNNGERNRIDETNGKYYILGTCLNFSQEEILSELEKYPEKFSPNALMRPVYQEVILPNAAYIGGNAEIAYWLELKNYFDSQQLPFPVLIPRNSMLLISEEQLKKMKKYHWKTEDLFMPKEEIIEKMISGISTVFIDFQKYENELNHIFDGLLKDSRQTDISLKNMVLAQQKKQMNGLQKVSLRFRKAEKLKNKEWISNFEKLHFEVFPEGIWQERIENFSEYFAIYGKDFMSFLYKDIKEFESVMILKILSV